MKKRKLLYIGIAVLTFLTGVSIASFALRASRSFTLLSIDGASGTSGLGISGKGISYSSSNWISSDDQTVEEITIGYPSATDAENDFQLEQRRAVQVIKLTKSRLVAKFDRSYMVIVLDADHLQFINASKLETALDWESSWSRYLSITPRPRPR